MLADGHRALVVGHADEERIVWLAEPLVAAEDMDPEVTQFLKATTVAVDGSALKIKLALDPESVVVALDN